LLLRRPDQDDPAAAPGRIEAPLGRARDAEESPQGATTSAALCAVTARSSQRDSIAGSVQAAMRCSISSGTATPRVLSTRRMSRPFSSLPRPLRRQLHEALCSSREIFRLARQSRKVREQLVPGLRRPRFEPATEAAGEAASVEQPGSARSLPRRERLDKHASRPLRSSRRSTAHPKQGRIVP
jgi:hypothetical protein